VISNHSDITIECLFTDTSKPKKVKVKSDYYIENPKIDQRADQLSLPHLGNFFICF